MRISTILKILGLLVIAVIVAIAAILFTINPNDYKDRIQQAAKNATGRDLAIDGDISLNIGLTSGLSVEKVRFANAAWGSRPDMLTAGEVGIQVALLPLISGQVDVKGLTIRDADILIETDKQGRLNTNFEPAGTAGQPAPTGGEATPAGSDANPISIAINNVEIENATVTVLNAVTGSDMKLVVSKLSASGDSAQSPLDIELAAQLTTDGKQLPLELSGSVGAPALLMAANQPYPIDIAGKALGIDFKAKGAINNPDTMTGIALALEASANDLSGLKPFAGDAVPTASPFSFAGNVTGGGKKFNIDGLALKLGSTEISGNLAADIGGARPRLDGTISASKIDLTELMPAPTESAASGSTASGSGASGGSANGGGRSGKVFPNDTLPLEALKLADAKLSIAVAELVAPGARLTDLTGDIALDNGNLAVKPFGFVISESRFDGSVSVSARSTPAKIAFGLKAPKVDMGKLLQEQADLDMLRGDAAVDIDVTGSGTSVAAIMASLNGYSRFLMENGQAKTEAFDLAIGGLSSVMGSLFGKDREWTVLNCLASDFEIVNGVAKSRATLMDTELLTITVDGQVNLGPETLALKITPAPKSTTISVAVPIKVGGTLANPSFAPDELAAAKKIGSLLGIVAFPPAAILGLTELGGSDNECVKLAQKGGEAPAGGSTMENLTKEPGKALEDVGKGLRGLFGN